jgi:hypothetical protein
VLTYKKAFKLGLLGSTSLRSPTLLGQNLRAALVPTLPVAK